MNGPNIDNGKGGYTADVSQRWLLVRTIDVVLTSLYQRTWWTRKGLHRQALYARLTYIVTQIVPLYCMDSNSASTGSVYKNAGSCADVGLSNMRAIEGVLLEGIPWVYMTRPIEVVMIVS